MFTDPKKKVTHQTEDEEDRAEEEEDDEPEDYGLDSDEMYDAKTGAN